MRLLLAALSALLASQAGAQGFEGRLVYHGRLGGEQMPTATYDIKGTRFRQELASAGGPSVLVVDEVARSALLREPGSGGAMAMRLPPISSADLVVTGLDRMDSVAGFSCREFRLELDGARLEVCNATGLGVTTAGVLPPVFGVDALRSAFPDGFLPLRTRQETANGVVVLEAVTVEPGPVSDRLFEID